MKKITSLLLLTICALVSNRASADLIAEWEFNSYSGGNAGGTADFGTQAGTALLTDFGGANGVSVAGTAANSADSVAGNAFRTSATGGAGGFNYSYSFQISGIGLSGFVVTYETQGTITTPQQWQWVATGQGGEHSFGSPVFASSSYGVQTIDFSGVTGLNNAATVVFYLDVGSPSDPAGSWTVDFDNFAISTVPEPVNTALACFGLGIAVVSLGRFYVSRRRRIS